MEKWQQEGYGSFRAWIKATDKARRDAKKTSDAAARKAVADPAITRAAEGLGADAGSRLDKRPGAEIDDVLEVTLRLAPMLDGSPPRKKLLRPSTTEPSPSGQNLVHTLHLCICMTQRLVGCTQQVQSTAQQLQLRKAKMPRHERCVWR